MTGFSRAITHFKLSKALFCTYSTGSVYHLPWTYQSFLFFGSFKHNVNSERRDDVCVDAQQLSDPVNSSVIVNCANHRCRCRRCLPSILSLYSTYYLVSIVYNIRQSIESINSHRCCAVVDNLPDIIGGIVRCSVVSTFRNPWSDSLFRWKACVVLLRPS